MKIIFDSEEELKKFYDEFCPNNIGLEIHCNNELYSDTSSCENCWKLSGLEYEIKTEQPIPEEIVLNLNDIIKVKFTDYGKELYYHRDDDMLGLFERCGIRPNYPTVDDEGYTKIQLWYFIQLFGKHIKLGMPQTIIENNNIYIQNNIKKESVKMLTYTDWVYMLIEEECEGMDSIYEDYIIKLVGQCGLEALRQAGLIETCGVINCRRLWVLCNKEK